MSHTLFLFTPTLSQFHSKIWDTHLFENTRENDITSEGISENKFRSTKTNQKLEKWYTAFTIMYQ